VFAKSSRYNGLKIIEAKAAHGRKVNVIILRRISLIDGDPVNIIGNDRLDVIAFDKYRDSTKFWHIADANTKLKASELVQKSIMLKSILVPKL
jgi:hypothetical protein